jgi:hypothetical protein
MNAADIRLAALAARQHGLLTHAQAIEVGLSERAVQHRLDASRWRQRHLGVYQLPGTSEGWRVDLHAAILSAGPGAVASHGAAAELRSFPGFRDGAVELSVRSTRSPEVEGAVIHRKCVLPSGHVEQFEGIPVTTVARTIFDLAGTVHPGRVERALDTCLARRLVTRSALQAVFDSLAKRGRTGTALMRRLLAARGPAYVAPASGLERRFLEILEDANLPVPDREIEVGGADGWGGRVEFVYRDARLLIEIDSRTYHSSLLDLEADRARDNRLMAAGWRMLRITEETLTRAAHVAGMVDQALRTAAS